MIFVLKKNKCHLKGQKYEFNLRDHTILSIYVCLCVLEDAFYFYFEKDNSGVT